MSLRRGQRRRKHERLQAVELAPAILLRHPMFAALAGVRNPAKVSQSLCSLVGGPSQTTCSWTSLYVSPVPSRWQSGALPIGACY